MCQLNLYVRSDENFVSETEQREPVKKRTRRSRSKRITPAPAQSKSERAQLAQLKRTDLNSFNTAAEQAFISLICKLIADEGPVTVREVMSEGSYELDISPETAKRYLFKHTARRAHFRFNETGLVTCDHAI
jgi:hypothetical protein